MASSNTDQARSSDPVGTVIIHFFTQQPLPSTDSPHQTVLKCYNKHILHTGDDVSAFSHPIIARAIAASGTFEKVLDPNIAEFFYWMPDLDFNQHAAQGLKADFTRWLANPDPKSRKLAPVAANKSIITLTAAVIGLDGLCKEVSLPPLRLIFTPIDPPLGDSTARESPSESASSISSTPLPSKAQPAGGVPHYYVITMADGAQRQITQLTLEQLQHCAKALHPLALKTTAFDAILGQDAALNAQLLFDAGPAADEGKVWALDNLMEIAAHYDRLASQVALDDPSTAGGRSTIHFNDWYVACCLSFGLRQGLECVQTVFPHDHIVDKYFPTAFRMGLRYYRLGAAIYHFPNSAFTDRPSLGPQEVALRFAGGITLCADFHTMQYVFTRDARVIDEAVRLYREGLHLPSLNSWYRQYLAEHLAEALLIRFNSLWDRTDLDDIIEAARECISHFPEGTAEAAPRVLLGRALVHRARLFRVAPDADQAIEEFRTAMHVPDDDSHIAVHLAEALMLRFTFSHDMADVDETIGYVRSLLKTTPKTDRTYSSLAGLLASALYERFKLSHNPEDAAESLLSAEDALRHDSIDGCRADHYHIKAMLYHLPYSPFHDDSASVHLLKHAVDDESVHVSRRFLYVNDWLQVRSKFTSLDDAAAQTFMNVVSSAIHLLPLIASLALDTGARLDALKQAPNITVGAVTIALLTGRPELALELVEEGRSVFWNQALRLRTQLNDVPERLREQFVKLRTSLENSGNSVFMSGASGASRVEDDTSNVRRRYHAEELAAVMQKIRALPGLDRFLLPHPPEMLKHVGDRGPVVLLTATCDACVALVIWNRQLFSVLLNIEQHHLDHWRKDWHDLAESTRRGGWPDDNPGVRDSAELDFAMDALSVDDSDATNRAARPIRRRRDQTSAYFSVLENLWKSVVNPILQVLAMKLASVKGRTRLWWCPTGPFMSLPLHAAGVYKSGGRSCSDYVVSSYTPSLQALLNARTSFRPQSKDKHKILLAAAPHPFVGKKIAVTVDEVRTVQRLVSPEHILPLPPADDVLQHPEGGVRAQTILDLISQTSIFHLASHGQQSPNDPLHSGFLLRDAKLTIADLMRQPLPDAFLAFLSACETAKEVDDYPEESVHLAAAMLFAGFKSVIATMWSMDDVDGPEVASRIYASLYAGDNDSLDSDVIPHALDSAVQELRARGVSPGRWATYIHVGI